MEKPIYIHYGSKEFNPNFVIENCRCFNKPKGGLWASRIDAPFGWKQWVKKEKATDMFSLSNSFTFSLKDGARILEIHKEQDALDLYEKYALQEEFAMPTIDFKRIKEDYDAVELFFSEDTSLYQAMFTWDCDSVVVLNPSVVEIKS